jgi:hypothetical protein
VWRMNQDDVQDQLNKVPQWIREYYGAYFAELRAQLERPDVFAAAVPDWMRGYKRVISVIGSDGVLVIHAPVEIEFSIPRDDGSMFVHYPALPSAMNDLYHFMAISEEPISVLANFMSSDVDIELSIQPGVSWGVKGHNTPQQRIDPSSGELLWVAPWSRLVAADSNHLRYWEDPESAREEAKTDVAPYIRP